MTLVLTPDLDMVKMYQHAKEEDVLACKGRS